MHMCTQDGCPTYPVIVWHMGCVTAEMGAVHDDSIPRYMMVVVCPAVHHIYHGCDHILLICWTT